MTSPCRISAINRNRPPHRSQVNTSNTDPRGFAPAGTPAASLAGTPDAPLRSADELALRARSRTTVSHQIRPLAAPPYRACFRRRLVSLQGHRPVLRRTRHNRPAPRGPRAEHAPGERAKRDEPWSAGVGPRAIPGRRPRQKRTAAAPTRRAVPGSRTDRTARASCYRATDAPGATAPPRRPHSRSRSLTTGGRKTYRHSRSRRARAPAGTT